MPQTGGMAVLQKPSHSSSLDPEGMLLICHSTAFGSQAALEVWIGFQLLLHMIQEVLHREALTSLTPKNTLSSAAHCSQ